jgi:hypothetical protein
MSYTIEYSVECLPEFMPIEGNASAIDPETDAQIAAHIKNELEAGNDWAWCAVRVKAAAFDDAGEQIAYGEDYLGGCSYSSETAFTACPYYEDMKTIAREECEAEILRIATAICEYEEENK